MRLLLNKHSAVSNGVVSFIRSAVGDKISALFVLTQNIAVSVQ